MLPEFPEYMRTRRFLWGGWGKENLEELGELEFGELEEGAWILKKENSGRDLARRHKGDGGSKGYRLCRRPLLAQDWRSGGLEDWWTGGLDDWRFGRLEDWRIDRLEDLRIGGLEDYGKRPCGS